MRLWFMVGIFAWTWLARASDCPQGQVAFDRHVFPLLQQHCTTCHDGSTGAPAHSVADPARAYTRFQRFVRFDRLEQSIALKKIESKHWEKAGGEVNVTSAEFKTALEKWWNDGQRACAVLPRFATRPQILPALATDKFLKVVIPIVETADLRDLTFQFEAQMLGAADSGYVLLRNPRISSPADGIEVTGVTFYVDDKPVAQANNWRKLRQISFPGRVPTLLTNSTVTLPIQPGSQTLVIRFEKLSRAKTARCKFLDVFRRDVESVFELRDCFYCHGGGSERHAGEPRAVAAFPMTGDRQALCDMSLQRMHGLEESAMIQLPLKGRQNHRQVLIGDEGALPNWVNWARKEFSQP